MPGPTDQLAPEQLVSRADRLEQDGRYREAAEALEHIDRDGREPLVDVRIVRLRHLAFADARRAGPGRDALGGRPDPFPGVTAAPETPAEALTIDLLCAAVEHHGCLIVRGLLAPDVCAGLRDDIDRSFAAYDERAFKPVETTAPWYAAIEHGDEFDALDPLAGAFLRSGGGVYAACAPRAFIDFRAALADAGVVDVIAGYLGEPAVLSVNKCVLRRIGGGAEPTWHQDGSYLGESLRALNLWTALSRCGGATDVMGLDILPGKQPGLAEMGTYDAVDPRAVSQHVVEELSARSGRPIERPLFDAGDGILFDQVFLHRSDVRAHTTERYAVESWFFAGSSMPAHQIPVVAS